MDDPFLKLVRSSTLARRGRTAAVALPAPSPPSSGVGGHEQRAHSKFSASGAERWFKCPGSVQLSEGLPDKSSVWAEEGTRAHEVLEVLLIGLQQFATPQCPRSVPLEMFQHGINAAKFIFGLHHDTVGSELLVETRIYLKFIHPEMFGTFDGAVVDHFGTLHVFDYKYGAGVAVGPKQNLQMIFYGIGLAHQYNWNFKRVRLWIIQPRIKGYDGPMFWELTIQELKNYVEDFQRAVDRVEAEPTTYAEGGHCHWCKAKKICPLKQQAKLEQAQMIFGKVPTP